MKIRLIQSLGKTGKYLSALPPARGPREGLQDFNLIYWGLNFARRPPPMRSELKSMPRKIRERDGRIGRAYDRKLRNLPGNCALEKEIISRCL